MSALAVVPGAAHTWIAGLCSPSYIPCGAGVVIFDDAVQRPTLGVGTQLTANSLAFVADPNMFYSTEFNQGPPDVSTFAISSGGVTRTATSSSAASAGGGTLASDGQLLYVSNGQVIDPSTLTVKFNYPSGAQAFALDKANSRLFFATSSSTARR